MDSLFNAKTDAKELHSYKRYSDLENDWLEVANNSDRVEARVIGESGGHDLYAFYAGNPDAEKRILVAAGHHGGEEAGPIAALEMIKDITASENPLMERFLEEAYLAVVPCVDAQGFDHRGRKFVDGDGDGTLWPTDKDRWWEDINGSHGRRDDDTKPSEVLAVEKVMEDHKPELVFDLHETVSGMNNLTSPLMEHQGLMIIESTRDDLPEQGDAIVRNLIDKGHDIYHDGLFEKIIQKLLPQPEQLVKVGEGRFAIGPLIEDLGVRVFTMLAKDMGAQGYTFETFDNPLSVRVEQQIIGVEGGILDYMGYKATERAGGFKGKIDMETFARYILNTDSFQTDAISRKGKNTDEYTRIYSDFGEIDFYGKGSTKVVEVKYARGLGYDAQLVKERFEKYCDTHNVKLLSDDVIDKAINDNVYNVHTPIRETIENAAASVAASVYSGLSVLRDYLPGGPSKERDLIDYEA